MRLNHNLLSIISLTKKNIKVFIRKTSQLSEIIINNEVFSLDNIIKNQYILQSVENLKFAIVNHIITLTIKFKHTQIGYL